MAATSLKKYMKKILLQIRKYNFLTDARAYTGHLLLAALTMFVSLPANAAPYKPGFNGVAVFAGNDGTVINYNNINKYSSGSVDTTNFSARYGVPGATNPAYTIAEFKRNTTFVCSSSAFGVATSSSAPVTISSCEVSIPSSYLSLVIQSDFFEKTIDLTKSYRPPVNQKPFYYFTNPIVVNQDFDSMVMLKVNNRTIGHYFAPAGVKVSAESLTKDEWAITTIRANAWNSASIHVLKTIPKTSVWALAKGANSMSFDAKSVIYRYGVKGDWTYTSVKNNVIDRESQSICDGPSGKGAQNSCQVLVEVGQPAAECGVSTVRWNSGGVANSCTAPKPNMKSGENLTLVNTDALFTGSINVLCTDGIVKPNSESTCTKKEVACAAGNIGWAGNNNERCTATVGVLESKSSLTISNTNPATTGSAALLCNNGVLGTTSKTCTQSAACPATTAEWIGATGLQCSGRVAAAASGAQPIVVSNTKWPHKGKETIQCRSGNWFPSNPECASLASTATVATDSAFYWPYRPRPIPQREYVADVDAVWRFGHSNTGWVYRPVAAGTVFKCDKDFFGFEFSKYDNKNNLHEPDCQAAIGKGNHGWGEIDRIGGYPDVAVGGNLLVRFGNAGNWAYRFLARGERVKCESFTMGYPPRLDNDSVCQIHSSPPDWVFAADEGAPFRVYGGMTVRYGFGESWVYRNAPDQGMHVDEFHCNAVRYRKMD
jgi:hypothetical protein